MQPNDGGSEPFWERKPWRYLSVGGGALVILLTVVIVGQMVIAVLGRIF